ncbi:1198_t:CDS:1, partial [Gigaspora rosea]
MSGYFFSSSSLQTKIVFSICTTSFTRLVEHFGDNEPKKIKTAISYFLNWDAIMDEKEAIEKLVENIEKAIKNLTKITYRVDAEKIDYIKYVLRGQQEELTNIILNYKKNNLEVKIRDVSEILTYQIRKINELRTKYNLDKLREIEDIVENVNRELKKRINDNALAHSTINFNDSFNESEMSVDRESQQNAEEFRRNRNNNIEDNDVNSDDTDSSDEL